MNQPILRMKKTVYLLSRCSTDAQATTGHSIERQVAATQEWITRTFPHWEISTNQYKLKGVSGYDGSSLGLGGFIEACKTGEIVKGKSVLAIEAIDRLGRLEPSMMRQLWSTIQKDYGIDIAVQKFGLLFDHSKELDLGNDLLLTAAIHLARLESEQKSQRVRAAVAARRVKARTLGTKTTRVCPRYMVYNEDTQDFDLIPERADLIRKMFDMKLNQDLGPDAIARRFTQAKIATFGSHPTWSRAVIRNYLTNKQAIGEYQPKETHKSEGVVEYKDAGSAIKGYFPVVVSDDIFYATQDTFKKAVKGKKGNMANLFRGIMKCPDCGGTLLIKMSKRSYGVKNYLRCSEAIRGHGCTFKQIEYFPIEYSLVALFSMLDYSRLQSTTDSGTLQLEIDDLRIKEKALDAQISGWMVGADMADPNIRQQVMDTINALSAERTLVISEIVSIQTQIMSMSISSIGSLDDLKLETFEERMAFNRFISQHVDKILPTKESINVQFKGKDGAVVQYLDPDSDSQQEDLNNDAGFLYWLFSMNEEEHDRAKSQIVHTMPVAIMKKMTYD
jgi:DNA invertase Pin-like site-specific DNA recombinase